MAPGPRGRRPRPGVERPRGPPHGQSLPVIIPPDPDTAGLPAPAQEGFPQVRWAPATPPNHPEGHPQGTGSTCLPGRDLRSRAGGPDPGAGPGARREAGVPPPSRPRPGPLTVVPPCAFPSSKPRAETASPPPLPRAGRVSVRGAPRGAQGLSNRGSGETLTAQSGQMSPPGVTGGPASRPRHTGHMAHAWWGGEAPR